MKISEYQELSKRTMPKMHKGKKKMRYSKWDKCNYGMGIAGEAGEVCDLLKKHIHHKHPLDLEKLKKELGDVQHYVAGICTMFGFSLEEIMTLNIQKLHERYPNGYCDADSLKRVDENKNVSVHGIRGEGNTFGKFSFKPRQDIIDEFNIHSLHPEILTKEEKETLNRMEMEKAYARNRKND